MLREMTSANHMAIQCGQTRMTKDGSNLRSSRCFVPSLVLSKGPKSSQAPPPHRYCSWAPLQSFALSPSPYLLYLTSPIVFILSPQSFSTDALTFLSPPFLPIFHLSPYLFLTLLLVCFSRCLSIALTKALLQSQFHVGTVDIGGPASRPLLSTTCQKY